VRTGLEDNVFISKGVLAKSNAHLVERLAEIIPEYNRHVASVKEARNIIGIA
jgi:3-keto-5-aminohexanoate cleavage enzyme